ncbi:MAG TPA: hypothetical protein PKY82_33845, partial [Pyrinomonadaceae bacterium]|nr:hypothetical protein [Pyrinomonadaceae bacterium]
MMLTTDQITVTFNLLTEEQRQEWRKAQIEEIRSIIGELAKLKIIEKIPDFNALNDVDLIEDLDAYRNQLSTRRKFLNMDEVDENEIVALYCDGGVISMNPSPIGGTWAWCGVNAKGERVIEQSGAFPAPESRPVSNNHTEQIAITKALEAMP